MVLKWEGLAPLALYPSAQQTSGIGLGRLFGGQDSSMRDRARMLRQGCSAGWLRRQGGRGDRGGRDSRASFLAWQLFAVPPPGLARAF